MARTGLRPDAAPGVALPVPMLAMLSSNTLHDATAPARAAVRWGLACTVVAAAVGGFVAGVPAAGAAAIGGVAGVMGGRSLVFGLAAAFRTPENADRARRRALVAALLRYPLLGAVLACSVIVLDLPASWLAVGVTAWPVSLIAAALRDNAGGAAARLP